MTCLLTPPVYSNSHVILNIPIELSDFFQKQDFLYGIQVGCAVQFRQDHKHLLTLLFFISVQITYKQAIQ